MFSVKRLDNSVEFCSYTEHDNLLCIQTRHQLQINFFRNYLNKVRPQAVAPHLIESLAFALRRGTLLICWGWPGLSFCPEEMYSSEEFDISVCSQCLLTYVKVSMRIASLRLETYIIYPRRATFSPYKVITYIVLCQMLLIMFWLHHTVFYIDGMVPQN